MVNRYRFHMAVQGMYKAARYHSGKAVFYCNMVLTQEQVHPDDFVELMHVLREARSALKKVLREARELDMPAMAGETGPRRGGHPEPGFPGEQRQHVPTEETTGSDQQHPPHLRPLQQGPADMVEFRIGFVIVVMIVMM